MPNSEQALQDFADRYRGIVLLSTGARVVNYEGVLYNVQGSSDDPDIDGANWKELLIRNGIESPCYVTNPLPDRNGTSHPDFQVGGHMTTNADGHVPVGGTCYLMPLCKWHNSKGRDGTPFAHKETRMLKLSGYMEGDIAATFAARMPGEAAFRLVSVKGDGLTAHAFDEPQLRVFKARPDAPKSYVVFRRVEAGGVVGFVIEDARPSDR